MPALPYTISGILLDVDGSTTATSGTCKVYNVTKGTSYTGNVESDGSFSVNIVSFSNNDKLQAVLYDTNKVKSTEFRHTVDASLAGYDVGNVILHWTKPVLGTATLSAVVISNKNDSNEYTVDFYDRVNDNKLLSCDVGVNTSFSPSLLFRGIQFDGGICVIREVDTANTVEVQMVTK